MSGTLRVLSGALTTVQDLGRLGWQAYGVPSAGAMDTFALVAANRLVGNAPDAAALEITASASFELSAPTLLALCGAGLGATLNDMPLPLWTAVLAPAGARLVLPGRGRDWGARAYLACAGGIDVPQVLGSRSTYLSGGFGGYAGRALRAGDVLPLAPAPHDPVRLAGRQWSAAMRPAYSAQPTLRLIPGPHVDLFAPGALETLCAQSWRINTTSNRMGYRLEGPSIRYAAPVSLASLGVLPGVIQVPPDGAPILLMADAQTTGGYPIIGVVITADLPLAAQLLPGDALQFALTDTATAREAWRTHCDWLAQPLPNDPDTEQLAWSGALPL